MIDLGLYNSTGSKNQKEAIVTRVIDALFCSKTDPKSVMLIFYIIYFFIISPHIFHKSLRESYAYGFGSKLSTKIGMLVKMVVKFSVSFDGPAITNPFFSEFQYENLLLPW